MLPRAIFKSVPEDFLVEELDAYPTEGEGPHTFVRIEKRGLTTDAAIARLCEALRVDRRAAGHAGMKDKDAVTTQRVSLPIVDPARVRELSFPDLRVLEAVRHRNKLKPGHLRGNRFTVRLRELDAARIDEVVEGLQRIAREGFPNAFGAQRFGRDGDNADRALAFVRGEAPPPRDPHQRRLLFSALQSRWFNRVLDDRVADGSWKTALEGDLLKKHETGGMFLCTDVETDRARAERLEVSPTGPIFGSEMARPGPAVLERELRVLSLDGLDLESLSRHRALGEGTRRPLRVLIEDLVSERTDDGLTVGLTLGKGVYATTALANVVQLEQPRPAPTPPLATGAARGHLATHQVEEGADGPEEPGSE
jgi:tRNA pseudouridine13 synthase